MEAFYVKVGSIWPVDILTYWHAGILAFWNANIVCSAWSLDILIGQMMADWPIKIFSSNASMLARQSPDDPDQV